MTRSVLCLLALLAISANGALGEKCSSIGTLPLPASVIREFGYPAESHSVTTSDGYILELSRVLNNGTQGSQAKPAILLVHGLTQSAGSFLILGSNALPFQLSNQGFDVWIGSLRGTSASMKHKNLSTKSKEFWDFSWHENAIYDVPAMMSYMKQVTGQERIQYVGHSMGCTIFLAMCAMLPEQCERDISGAYLMGPVAYMSHSMGWHRTIAEVVEYPVLGEMLTKFIVDHTFGEIQASYPIWRYMSVPFCTSPVTDQKCVTMMKSLTGGGGEGSVTAEDMGNFFCFSLDNLSLRQFLHFMQLLMKPNWFGQYDYKNPIENFMKYGSFSPPAYKLNKISTPVSLYLSQNDYYVQPADLKKTMSELPNIKRTRTVDNTLFTHNDFVISKEAKTLVYPQLVVDALQDTEA